MRDCKKVLKEDTFFNCRKTTKTGVEVVHLYDTFVSKNDNKIMIIVMLK